MGTRTFCCVFFATAISFAPQISKADSRYDNLTLEQCIQIALENHQSIAVSEASLQIAESQYRQAMSAYWPRVSIETNFQRADEDRTFTFQGSVQTPAMSFSMMGQPVTIPSQNLPMNLDVKLYDRDTTTAALSVNVPLYTGGRIDAIAGKARAGVGIAHEERRKAGMEIVRDVRRFYFGASFAKQMEALTTETQERFTALEALTEKFYQSASLKVKKTDYLRAKTMTSIVRNLATEARYATAVSREALINAMGLPASSSISIAATGAIPLPEQGRLDAILQDAQRFNPDLQRLELAIQSAEHGIAEARSGYYPVIGLQASTYRIWNDYTGGLFNDANRNGWTIGIGVRWDLFNGFQTQSAVDTARANKIRLEGQRVLLDQGLALQIKDAFLRVQHSREQLQSADEARRNAREHRDLNVRAYQEELVETKDVIEAEIMESIASGNKFRAEHALRTALADLDYLVGKGLQNADPVR